MDFDAKRVDLVSEAIENDDLAEALAVFWFARKLVPIPLHVDSEAVEYSTSTTNY